MDVVKPYVPLSSLDPADVVPVKPRHRTQLLLRQSAFETEAPDPTAELCSMLTGLLFLRGHSG